MEHLSRSLNVSDGVTRNLLDGVDKRQARGLALASKMMAARADLYRASETLVGILIQQYGHYTVGANGQFLFPDQPALDRFNVAANAVNTATTKLNQVDAERKQLEQYEQEGWNKLVSKKMN